MKFCYLYNTVFFHHIELGRSFQMHATFGGMFNSPKHSIMLSHIAKLLDHQYVNNYA